jgi:hypothetical protein
MRTFFLLSQLIFSISLMAQNVGVGTASPQASAILDVSSANKGLLMPRNADPVANVASPATGLMLYNSSSNEPNYFNGTQWQSMANNAQQFRSSIAFAGVLYTGTPSAVDFAWVVPAGITSIWVEIWAAGDAGSNMPATTSDELSAYTGAGGDAGGYLSVLLPVTPGNSLTVTVGKGGTTNFPGGGSSAITNGLAKYIVSQSTTGFTNTVNGLLTNPAPHVLAFVAGAAGHTSQQTFHQTGSTTYRRVLTGGRGGDTYLGGKGGMGRVISYDMATGNPFPGGLSVSSGKAGGAPGGGGGAGFEAPGSGGPGLVIIHY